MIKHLLCNGLEAKALIDTRAAITAVSKEFADSIKKSLRNWNGPSVSLANGQVVYPKKGVEISVKIRNHTAKGLAVVMPLTDSDILLGNDFLKQFGSLNINYQESVGRWTQN